MKFSACARRANGRWSTPVMWDRSRPSATVQSMFGPKWMNRIDPRIGSKDSTNHRLFIPPLEISTKVFCTSDPNLVILTWMGDELWCGQAQNGVNLDFDLKFGLEGHGRSLRKTIGTLTKLFCTFGPNLVILAGTGPELSRRQASDWHTHRHTDAGNDNTRRPKLASGKKKP